MPGLEVVAEPLSGGRNTSFKHSYNPSVPGGDNSKSHRSNLRGLVSKDRVITLKQQLQNAENNAKLSIGVNVMWPN